jgi:hypothetical protein
MFRKIQTAIACSALLLSACTLGPSYNPPAPPMPLTWQETAPWRPAEPRDTVPRGA